MIYVIEVIEMVEFPEKMPFVDIPEDAIAIEIISQIGKPYIRCLRPKYKGV